MQDRADGKLGEQTSSIDIEGLVNRLRERAENKTAGPVQVDALVGPDPAAGPLSMQAEFNHSLMAAVQSMLHHLTRLEERCGRLETRLARPEGESGPTTLPADIVERLETVEQKVESAMETLSDASQLGSQMEALELRFEQLNLLRDERDQLLTKQIARVRRELQEEIQLGLHELEETRRRLEAADRRSLQGQDQVQQLTTELDRAKEALFDLRGSLARAEPMERQMAEAARSSVDLAFQVRSLVQSIGALGADLAELDSRSTRTEQSWQEHAAGETARSREQEERIEQIRNELFRQIQEQQARLPQPAAIAPGPDRSDQLDELRARLLRAELKLRDLDTHPAQPEPGFGEQADHGGNGRGGERKRSNGQSTDPLDEEAFDYFNYELRFRGSRAEIRERQSSYLDLFRGCQKVLDLGCGRGEFIELLKENGIPALGVDKNRDMAGFCQARGLPVVRGDIFELLSAQADESVDGMMLSQVVEHFLPQRIGELLNLCAAKLSPGGIMVIESVNTLCPGVLENFYMDPTHVRPVPARLLTFMVEQAGLKVRSLRFTQPLPEHSGPRVLETPAELAHGADQYQDYAVLVAKEAVPAERVGSDTGQGV